MKKEKNIGVLTPHDEEVQKLASTVKSGLKIFHFKSILEIAEKAKDLEFSGFIINQDFLKQLLGTDKIVFSNITNAFPTIDSTIAAKKPDEVESFKSRITAFVPRRVRLKFRKSFFLNLKVIEAGNLVFSDPFYTNSFNISEEGLFIVGLSEVNINEKVKLLIQDLSDLKPVTGIAKWILPWGKSKSQPFGLGIQFSNLSQSQKQEIANFLKV